MKTTTLFLILSLMIPLQSALSADCKAGQYFDTTYNRCLMTVDTAEIKAKASACDGLSGDALKICFNNNASSQLTSLEGEGLEKLDEDQEDFNKGSGMKIAVPMAITLLTSYYLFLNKDKFKDCKSTSIWLLFGAGVSSFVGEISAQITYKAKTKDLEQKYKDKMSEYKNDDKKYAAINKNQEFAFDYMEAAEKARLTAEKIRFGTYTLATTLYAGAAVAAAGEALSKTGTCTQKPVKSSTSLNMGFDFMQVVDKDFGAYHYIKNITYSEFIEIAVRKVANIIIPSAHAQETQATVPAGSQELATGEWVSSQTSATGETTYNYYGINGNLLGAYNETSFVNVDGELVTITDEGFDVGVVLDESVVVHCEDSAKTYNKLTDKCELKASNPPAGVAEAAKEIFGNFDEFEVAKTHLNILDKAMRSPIFRGGLAVAVGAYTFTLAKQAKENIEILKKRIAAIQKLKSDFVANGGTSGIETCNMLEEQDEEPARCRGIRANGNNGKTLKDWDLLAGASSGGQKVCIGQNDKIDPACECRKNNSCTRIPSGFSIGNLGNSSWANALAGPTNDLLTGSISGGQLDTADLNKKSYALKAKLKKMSKDSKYSDIASKINSIGDKIKASNLRLYKKSFPAGAPRSLASISSGVSSSMPTSAKDVIKSVKEKISASTKSQFSAGGTLGDTAKADNGLDFDWGSSGGKGAGIVVEDVASVMNKNYKITGDINKNSSQDIFKILSIRYQRSGLRRLFDESGKSSHDEANNSDINEK